MAERLSYPAGRKPQKQSSFEFETDDFIPLETKKNIRYFSK